MRPEPSPRRAGETQRSSSLSGSRRRTHGLASVLTLLSVAVSPLLSAAAVTTAQQVALSNSLWARQSDTASTAARSPQPVLARLVSQPANVTGCCCRCVSAHHVLEKEEKEEKENPPLPSSASAAAAVSASAAAPLPLALHHDERSQSPAPPLQFPPTPPVGSSVLPPASSAPPAAAVSAEQPLTSAVASQLRGQYEADFFALLDADLATVNAFFRTQEEFFLSKWQVLSEQLTAALSQQPPAPPAPQPPGPPLPAHAAAVLSRALKELYRGLQLLRNWRILNYTAFVKILKKHDKLGCFASSSLCLPVVNAACFVASPLLTDMIARCEQLYGAVFKQGSKHAAASLRVDDAPLSGWLTFRLGLLVGLSLSLLFVLPFLVEALSSAQSLPDLAAPLPVFRCLGLIFLNLWLWGGCTQLLHLARINQVFVLELDPRHYARPVEVVHAAAVLTFLWLGTLDLYLYTALQKASGDASYAGVQPPFLPFSLFLLSLLLLLTPFRVFLYRTRAFLAFCLGRIAFAPWWRVEFVDAFVADQLCSLVNIFGDVLYSLCFFASGDFRQYDAGTCSAASSDALWVLAVLPYYWRLMQCLRRYRDTGNTRFLGNAVKYCSSILITLLNLTYQQLDSSLTLGLWVAAAIAGTAYIYVRAAAAATCSHHCDAGCRSDCHLPSPCLPAASACCFAAVLGREVRLGSAAPFVSVAVVASLLAAAAAGVRWSSVAVLRVDAAEPAAARDLGLHHQSVDLQCGHRRGLLPLHRHLAGDRAAPAVEHLPPGERAPDQLRAEPRRQHRPAAHRPHCRRPARAHRA